MSTPHTMPQRQDAENPAGLRFRAGRVDIETRDGDEQPSVRISVSSELPVRTYGLVDGQWREFYEVLDHSPESVNLERAQRGLVLLDRHYGDQVARGTVELRGGKLYVTDPKWGRAQRAQDIRGDVMDGIRQEMSIGYAVDPASYVPAGTRDGLPVYRATAWTPYEGSFEPVPADPSVGVGRSAHTTLPQQETTTMPEETTPTTDAEAQRIRVQEQADKATEKVRKAELTRAKEIRAIAAQFGMADAGEAAIADGTTLDQFRQQTLDAVSARRNDVRTGGNDDASIGMNRKEIQAYSLLDAIRCQLPDGNIDDGFYRELSQEVASRRGKSPQGLWVPDDVLQFPNLANTGPRGAGNISLGQMRSMLQRSLATRDITVAGTGSNVVATDLISGSFIDLLLNKMVLNTLGIETMSGLTGDIAIPKASAGATMYWLSESEEVTESTPTFTQITGTPKTGGATVDLSRKLLQQSSIDVEAWVRNEIARRIAIGLDVAGIHGTGADGQPSGLLQNSDIADQTVTAATPTFAQIAAFEESIETDNADIGSYAFAASPRVKRVLRTTLKDADSGYGGWIMENGEIDGVRCEVSNQLTSSGTYYLILGVWSQLMMLMWGSLDLMVNPYTQSKKGIVEVTAFRDVDFIVRHGQAFAYSDDITG